MQLSAWEVHFKLIVSFMCNIDNIFELCRIDRFAFSRFSRFKHLQGSTRNELRVKYFNSGRNPFRLIALSAAIYMD